MDPNISTAADRERPHVTLARGDRASAAATPSLAARAARAARACLAAAVVLSVACALPATARAAGTSAADRDAARGLAGKGYEQFEAGHYARAIELFFQAESRYHAPPHWLYIARSQVKLGKLLEAEATYQRLLDEKLGPDAPAPFKEAQVSARAELAEAQVLVPSMIIELEGEVPAGTRVLVDGHPIELQAIGRPLRANPGTHLVTAEPPGQTPIGRSVSLALGGGEDTHVSLAFPKRRGSIVPAIVCFSVGAAGLGVGVTTAVLAARAEPGTEGGLRIAEIAGFAAGGAGVVAGIVLAVVRPGGVAEPPKVTFGPLRDVRVGLGAGSISLAARF